MQRDALERHSEPFVRKDRASSERASRYKSEFLANMSHELRTPLNSSLILAKLLADNKEGNLNPEQIRVRQHHLLRRQRSVGLIAAFILDLSKIRSGQESSSASGANHAWRALI